MRYIDSFLNNITMYRLVMWGLVLLAITVIVFGFLGLIAYSGLSLLGLLGITFVVTYAADFVLGRVFNSPQNSESSYITGLILFCILAPIITPADIYFAALASTAAALSKYVLAINKRHIFNPAAMGAFIASLFGGLTLWWIGTPIMLPFVLVLGLLIVRKIRRFDLFLSFVLVASLIFIIQAILSGEAPLQALSQHYLSWPLFFFAGVMLTEPFTTPPTRRLRIVYGSIVGVLFSVPFHLGAVYSSPELALILGCIFSYLVSSKQRIKLLFKEQINQSKAVQEFIFIPDQKPKFVPGQYMEWTLPHKKPDLRGNRRYFTICSAPEDKEVRLAVRIGEHSSSYKRALREMKSGDSLFAASIAGEFVMPKDASIALLCIAGGVGITPFVSFMRHMIDVREKRDIVLIYLVTHMDDAAFSDVIEKAKNVGVHTIVLAGAQITPEWLEREVPDYSTRHFYLSGPNAMVVAYKKLVRYLGVSSAHIRTDYFPGL